MSLDSEHRQLEAIEQDARDLLAGFHLARIRVATPVTPFMTFSLGQEFKLILAHERRRPPQPPVR